MKNPVQEKFEGYQKITKSNFETIRELIHQARRLDELLNKIKDDPSKKAIKEIQKDMGKTINELLDNTNKSFEEYKELIEKYAAVA
jgi:arsenate reductase-like glutaredoxin family protein